MKLTLPSGTTGFVDDAGKWICTGSQFGRRDELPDDPNSVCKLRLTRLPFIDGDYDRWGAYFGSPANVWCGWGNSGDTGVRVFVRANSREAAKEKITEKLPSAKFYR